MENTKQTVQEMREELVNHFKYLGEIREACNPEHLESLTDAMIKIYNALSNVNNNIERETYSFEGASINGVLKEEGQSIEKPLEQGEGGQVEEVPKCLTDWINSFAKKLDKEVSKGESSLVIIEI